MIGAKAAGRPKRGKQDAESLPKADSILTLRALHNGSLAQAAWPPAVQKGGLRAGKC